MSSQPTWWQQRVLAPLLAQLRQGTSPHEIALTVALGAVLGLFPIWGATTALCAIAALWLRLNQPLIQAVNYLLAPLHLLLLLPFYKGGEILLGRAPLPLFSLEELGRRFEASPTAFFADYAQFLLGGVVLWMLLAPLMAGLIYMVARRLLTLRRRPS